VIPSITSHKISTTPTKVSLYPNPTNSHPNLNPNFHPHINTKSHQPSHSVPTPPTKKQSNSPNSNTPITSITQIHPIQVITNPDSPPPTQEIEDIPSDTNSNNYNHHISKIQVQVNVNLYLFTDKCNSTITSTGIYILSNLSNCLSPKIQLSHLYNPKSK
jgi:hypothetical protein